MITTDDANVCAALCTSMGGKNHYAVFIIN